MYTSVGTITGSDSDWKNSWNGVDFTLTAHAANGLTVNFGTSTGRATVDYCAVAAKAPEIFNPVLTGGPGAAPQGFANGIFNLASSCKYQEKWQTQARGFVTYVVPKVDVLLSAIVRSSPNVAFGFGSTPEGNSQGLSANLPQAANGVAGYGFNMLPPGQYYGDRVNITDVRFGKIFRMGRARTNVAIDLLNLFNTNTATMFQQQYGGAYLTPQAIVSARVAKLNVTVDF